MSSFRLRFLILFLFVCPLFLCSLVVPNVEDVLSPSGIRLRNHDVESSFMGTSLVQTVTGDLYLLDLDLGRVVWNTSLSELGPLVTSTNYSAESFIVPSVSGGLYLYSRRVNSFEKLPVSVKELVDYSPFEADDGTLYLSSKETHLLDVDMKSGHVWIVGEEDSSETELRNKGPLVKRFVFVDYVIEGRNQSSGVKFNLSFSEMLPFGSSDGQKEPGKVLLDLDDRLTFSTSDKSLYVQTLTAVTTFDMFSSQPIAMFVPVASKSGDLRFLKAMLPLIVLNEDYSYSRTDDSLIYVTSVGRATKEEEKEEDGSESEPDDDMDDVKHLFAIEVPRLSPEDSGRTAVGSLGRTGSGSSGQEFLGMVNDELPRKSTTILHGEREKANRNRPLMDESEATTEMNTNVMKFYPEPKSSRGLQKSSKFFGLHALEPFTNDRCLNKHILMLQLRGGSTRNDFRRLGWSRSHSYPFSSSSSSGSEPDGVSASSERGEGDVELGEIGNVSFEQGEIDRFSLQMNRLAWGIVVLLFVALVVLLVVHVRSRMKSPSESSDLKNDATNDPVDAESEGEDEAPPTPTPEAVGVPPPPEDPDIKVIEDLRIRKTEILGKGANGTIVFRGDIGQRPVAVKRMLKEFCLFAECEISILLESDDHPNIIKYYAMKEDEQFVYLALELCPMSLGDLMTSDENLSYAKKRDILLHLGRAVHHLHALKIVHRDLKPTNVLCRPAASGWGYDTKLTDMGLGKRISKEQSSFHSTVHGTVVGTYGWQAPELLLKDMRKTKAIDIFSYGCIIFFVMTNGGHPFGSDFERQKNVLDGNFDIRRLGGVPEVEQLVADMLHPVPENRPPIKVVLAHPLFWSIEKRLNFVCDVSDQLNLYFRDNQVEHELLAILQSKSRLFFSRAGWGRRIDDVVLRQVQKYRRYDHRKVWDLLRMIRNVTNHYREYSREVQDLLDGLPVGVYLYFFTKRFKKLFCEMYYEVRAFGWFENVPMFRKYSYPELGGE